MILRRDLRPTIPLDPHHPLALTLYHTKITCPQTARATSTSPLAHNHSGPPTTAIADEPGATMPKHRRTAKTVPNNPPPEQLHHLSHLQRIRAVRRPVGARRKHDVDLLPPALAGCGVLACKAAIAHQCLEPRPLASRRDARPQVSPRLAGRWPVAPRLGQHAAPAQWRSLRKRSVSSSCSRGEFLTGGVPDREFLTAGVPDRGLFFLAIAVSGEFLTEVCFLGDSGLADVRLLVGRIARCGLVVIETRS